MKRIFFSGLMLMSFFFGAGNLIFAPGLGLQSGSSFWEAITGFNLSAALLPLLAMLAVAFAGDSALSFAGRIGKLYGYVFTVVIIFSIGPLFAIPRVANVSYNIGIAPLFQESANIISLPGISYIAFFFAASYLLVLFGDKLVDTIGKFLSPALIIFIFALIIGYFVTVTPGEVGPVAEKYQEFAAGAGALDGYQTLDAVAAVAFAGIIISTFRTRKDQPIKEILPSVIGAGAVAAIFLAVIYLGLGLLGNAAYASGKTEGADILVWASNETFGSAGNAVFAIIVFLACITTAVGLLKTISNYCYNLFGLVSEGYWLVFFTFTSILFSLQGLDTIIKMSVPMIYLCYPITISVTIITLANKFTYERAWIYRMVAIFVTPVAFADAFKILGSLLGQETPVDFIWFLRDLPLMSSDFSWVLPLVCGVVIGSFFPKTTCKTYLLEEELAKKSATNMD